MSETTQKPQESGLSEQKEITSPQEAKQTQTAPPKQSTKKNENRLMMVDQYLKKVKQGQEIADLMRSLFKTKYWFPRRMKALYRLLFG